MSTPAVPLPDLDAPYALTAAHVARYREQGFIKLKEVFSPEALAVYGAAITSEVQARARPAPMAARDTYGKAFLQVMNLWRHGGLAEAFVRGRRLARLAAQLMRVDGVRLYHDQALYKEAGGGHTPWHCDQVYWPLEGTATCTAWVPLQAVPPDMGPLAFAVASHRCAFGRDYVISDESERVLAASLRELEVDEGPFDLGEISFHAGWTFHRAGPNTSATPRAVMTVIYMADGIRLAAPRSPDQVRDQEQWMPGAMVGQPVATALNPVLWKQEA